MQICQNQLHVYDLIGINSVLILCFLQDSVLTEAKSSTQK